MLLRFQKHFLINILNIGQTAQVSSHKHPLISYRRKGCPIVLIVISHRSWLRLKCGIFQVFLCARIVKRMDSRLSLLDLRFGLDGFAEHNGFLECERLVTFIVFDTNSKLVLFFHDFVHLVDHYFLSLYESDFVHRTLFDLLIELIKILHVHLQEFFDFIDVLNLANVFLDALQLGLLTLEPFCVFSAGRPLLRDSFTISLKEFCLILHVI